MMKIIKGLIPYVLILVAVIFIRVYIVTPAFVSGTSMSPTLKDNDLVLLKKFDKKYKRFDIVVVRLPEENLIKRVIGLPGETLEYKDHILYINGKKVDDKFASITNDFSLEQSFNIYKIPDNCYFVMGDNRDNSKDSRIIGCVKKKQIVGRANLVIYPFKDKGHRK